MKIYEYISFTHDYIYIIYLIFLFTYILPAQSTWGFWPMLSWAVVPDSFKL